MTLLVIILLCMLWPPFAIVVMLALVGWTAAVLLFGKSAPK